MSFILNAPQTDHRGYATDPKEVLACFQAGAEFTLCSKGAPLFLPTAVAVEVKLSGERGIGSLSWRNEWIVAISAKMAKAIRRLGLLEDDCGNFETGERHYRYCKPTEEPCEASTVFKSLKAGATIVKGTMSALPIPALYDLYIATTKPENHEMMGHMIFGIEPDMYIPRPYSLISPEFFSDLLTLNLIHEAWTDEETLTVGYLADFTLPIMAEENTAEAS